MRVLVFAPEDLPIPPTRGGSVQIYLDNLSRALVQSPDFKFTVFCPSPSDRKKSGARGDDTLHYVQRGKSKRDYWAAAHQYVARTKPDVIQVDNRPREALRLKRMFPEIPVVLNLHSTTFLGQMHLTKREAQALFQTVDAVVCNSHSLEEQVATMFGISKREQFRVIYPGVEHPPTSNSAHHQAKDTLRLLFVGRVIRQKGVHIAIEAVRLLATTHSVRLTIVGRTPPWEMSYRRDLQKRARGLPIRFNGFVKPQDMASIYSAHDALLCPSQSHEAFGLVNIEAMSYGLPVIASDVGGIPEAVGEGGILVSSFTQPRAFADAIQTLQDDRARRHFERAALRQAAKFRWDVTAKQFTSLYRKLHQS